MTELLKQHSNVKRARKAMADIAAAGDYTEHPFDESYRQGGTLKYLLGSASFATGGRIGNLAAAFLGSYSLKAQVLWVDPDTGTARISFIVTNDSTAGSGFRPVVGGYGNEWKQTGEKVINFAAEHAPTIGNLRQMMSKTSQRFYWTETIYIGRYNPGVTKT